MVIKSSFSFWLVRNPKTENGRKTSELYKMFQKTSNNTIFIFHPQVQHRMSLVPSTVPGKSYSSSVFFAKAKELFLQKYSSE